MWIQEGTSSSPAFPPNDTTGDITFNSSDTWVAEVGFQCLDLESEPQPESECAFGTAGFDPSKSKTFKSDPNKNFNITYGDGEFLTGAVGLETFEVGGMTVASQEIGLVKTAAWFGDGVNTGLMGLAYPGLTSVFKGNDPDTDQFPGTQLVYNPVFFTAVKEGVTSKPCE